MNHSLQPHRFLNRTLSQRWSITSRRIHRKVRSPQHALPPTPVHSTPLLSPQPPTFRARRRSRPLLSFLDRTWLILLVVVRFKSIGSAPIMKNNVFKVTAGNRFQAVIVFLRSQLGLTQGDPLVSLPTFPRVLLWLRSR